jgi:hypothetical protein
MRRAINVVLICAAISMLVLVSPRRGQSSSQEDVKLPKSIFIQGEAMGQAQQLGQMFSVNLTINEFSNAEDQKILLDAFNTKQNEGLVNALSKMKSKGRIAITGTLGYDVNYIRKFDLPDGSTKIRLVTDRPIMFGEAWTDSRSSDYNLSGMEVIITSDNKKNTGTLAPACKFKIDKENQLQLELLQNEWKMVNLKRR